MQVEVVPLVERREFERKPDQVLDPARLFRQLANGLQGGGVDFYI